jgi:hypothetical protein
MPPYSNWQGRNVVQGTTMIQLGLGYDDDRPMYTSSGTVCEFSRIQSTLCGDQKESDATFVVVQRIYPERTGMETERIVTRTNTDGTTRVIDDRRNVMVPI